MIFEPPAVKMDLSTFKEVFCKNKIFFELRYTSSVGDFQKSQKIIQVGFYCIVRVLPQKNEFPYPRCVSDDFEGLPIFIHPNIQRVNASWGEAFNITCQAYVGIRGNLDIIRDGISGSWDKKTMVQSGMVIIL